MTHRLEKRGHMRLHILRATTPSAPPLTITVDGTLVTELNDLSINKLPTVDDYALASCY